MKIDPELKDLLDKLEFVKTPRTFRRWKGSFLTAWEKYLEEKNIEAADKAYNDFSKSMKHFVELINNVNSHIEKGELTVERTTVKARNALNEMSKVMTMVIDEEDALIPQTGALEKERGYNKFHIGSVLVRDDFDEYGRLSYCADILQKMRTDSLGEVADKQILEEMDNYKAKLKKFCDVMADLGLFEVMLKCREFADADEGPNLEEFIILDMKTGGIGLLDREDLLLQNIIHSRGADENGNEIFAETPTVEDAKEKLVKMILENAKLGFGFGQNKNAYEEEEVTISEIEKVQNMWGVKLKKTPKNKKGEELLFVDQKNGALGELSRASCLTKALLTEEKGENGKFFLKEAVLDPEDRSELMERVRTLLKLGVDRE